MSGLALPRNHINTVWSFRCLLFVICLRIHGIRIARKDLIKIKINSERSRFRNLYYIILLYSNNNNNKYKRDVFLIQMFAKMRKLLGTEEQSLAFDEPINFTRTSQNRRKYDKCLSTRSKSTVFECRQSRLLNFNNYFFILYFYRCILPEGWTTFSDFVLLLCLGVYIWRWDCKFLGKIADLPSLIVSLNSSEIEQLILKNSTGLWFFFFSHNFLDCLYYWENDQNFMVSLFTQ